MELKLYYLYKGEVSPFFSNSEELEAHLKESNIDKDSNFLYKKGCILHQSGMETELDYYTADAIINRAKHYEQKKNKNTKND